MTLYEEIGVSDDVVSTSVTGTPEEEKVGMEVIRTQWLDFATLESHALNVIGKNVLIVDEVDDTRTTLHYAVSELQKDVKIQAKKLGREDEVTQFFIFVLHNKEKAKHAELPEDLMAEGRYLAAETTKDIWIAYPWEATDIDIQTDLAVKQGHI